MAEQLPLPLGPIHNSNLFSNHWLENRLPREPEWNELRDQSHAVLDQLADLWTQQRDRVERYDDEKGLEEAFIQPVLQLLGWKLKYQPRLGGDNPDYALFVNDADLDAALKAGRLSADFWQFPAVLAEAKAWDLSLDRRMIDQQKREYPPQQISRYLNRTHLPFAILTNGRRWRLIPREHTQDQALFVTYLEGDLRFLLDDWIKIPANAPALERKQYAFDQFLRFFLFFSPVGYVSIQGRVPLVQRAAQGSSEYRLGVGEGLRERVFKALELCIEGFLSHGPNQLSPQADLASCRQNSFTLLYRLLFIMYAEDRGLLPYRTNTTYTENRSLGRYRDDIAHRLDRVRLRPDLEYPKTTVELWGELDKLFDLIDGGGRYGVPAYNGGLFDRDAHPFLGYKVIPDPYLARVIDQLGRAPDPQHRDVGLARVDYRDLAIQHLGSIYEGLLEQYPHCADKPINVVRRKGRDDGEEQDRPAKDGVPRGFEVVSSYEAGHVFLLNQKGERRASGSYYTPNHIVDYIVEKTLGPICKKIDQNLKAEIEQAQADLKGLRNDRRKEQIRKIANLQADFDDRILALRVLDPAMGSGHFLLRVCQYLAEEIATNPSTGDPNADVAGGDASTLTFWKRRIVEHCIYGVDLNPVAVELAKLALWLETASVRQPLTFLDHHLRCGNSLVGADIQVMGTLPGEKIKGRLLAGQVTARLPTMLKALADIAALPSAAVKQVKDKEDLYRKVFDPARWPLLVASDVWCAKLFMPKAQAATPNQYQDLLLALDTPAKLGKIAAEPWARASLKSARSDSVNCFHWQLEFPEAFFGPQGLRDSGGFDAIVGNPPYDVLSELETGHDLSGFTAFLKAQPLYGPSFRGKNNLYKLFVCRAMDLLADGGRLGFITPMAILGDDQAADLRRMILTSGTFTSIDAFPQEDRPDLRVFPEAKMCTAIFTVVKTDDTQLRGEPFVSRRNPANIVDLTAPKLLIGNTDVGLYDPANLTIISCHQDDWDIAARIIRNGRMGRLGESVSFFQGEVNETNAKKDGCLTGSKGGKLVTRGACVCLYVTRLASQGTDLYLNVAKFLEGKPESAKAWHHRHPRVVLQELASRSNVRRVIAARLAAGEFCNHTINYAPQHLSKLNLDLLIGLLDSTLSEWYFRLGSTNAHISQYQLQNLPCPAFAEKSTAADAKMLADALAVLDDWAAGPGKKGKADPEQMIRDVCRILQPAMAVPPYGQAARDAIVELVKRITAIEAARGEIARTERSHLAPAAQPYQDMIDRILYALAGLTETEWRGMEERLKTML